MRYLGRSLAVAGLAFSIWLFLHDNPSAIVALLRHAGLGLAAASLIHLLPMILNARGWQVLLPGASRPTLVTMLRLVWIRESINGLLPVARIGGELVAFRMMRMIGVRRAPAAASLVVDTGLCLLCQVAVALLGIGLLANYRTDDLLWQLAIGLAIATPIVIVFVLLQPAYPFEKAVRFARRFVPNELAGTLAQSIRIDRAIRVTYRRRAVVVRSALWQLSGYLAEALEIWAALWLLGHPTGLATPVIVEAVIVAVGSAGFLVPGAIGIQEGSFLMIGTVLGLDPSTALALAAARRLRDCIVFFPGICAWYAAEGQESRRRKQKDLVPALKSRHQW